MKNKFAVWVLLVSCTVLAGTAFAHHGNVAYDEEHLLTQKDVTITNFVWANPHSIIQYDVKDASGIALAGIVAAWRGRWSCQRFPNRPDGFHISTATITR